MRPTAKLCIVTPEGENHLMTNESTTSPEMGKVRKSWPLMVSAFFIVLLFWFGWLYPLLPKTPTGWLIETFAGVFVFFYGWSCIEIILWLQVQTRLVVIAKAVGLLVALSLGVGVFAAAYYGQQYVSGNFEYFGH